MEQQKEQEMEQQKVLLQEGSGQESLEEQNKPFDIVDDIDNMEEMNKMKHNKESDNTKDAWTGEKYDHAALTLKKVEAVKEAWQEQEFYKEAEPEEAEYLEQELLQEEIIAAQTRERQKQVRQKETFN